MRTLAAIALVCGSMSAAAACRDFAADRSQPENGRGTDLTSVDGDGTAHTSPSATTDAATDAPDASIDVTDTTDATDAAESSSYDVVVGATVYPEDTTKIVLSQTGGLPPPPAAGSTCQPVDDTYAIALPSRALTWTRCVWKDAGLYEFHSGQKTLTAEEYAPIDNALHALTLSTKKALAADKPEGQITFTTPSGDATYHDDFYGWRAMPGYAYVAGFDGVVSPLGQYAR